MSKGKKPWDDPYCIVKNCENRKSLGAFVGDLCAPCWNELTEGNSPHSQLFRNGILNAIRFLKNGGHLRNIDIAENKPA